MLVLVLGMWRWEVIVVKILKRCLVVVKHILVGLILNLQGRILLEAKVVVEPGLVQDGLHKQHKVCFFL